jgi:hypothetical protein
MSMMTSRGCAFRSKENQENDAQAADYMEASHPNSTDYLSDRYAASELQPKSFTHTANGRFSAGIRSLLLEAKGADLSWPAEAPVLGEIIPEWWRHHLGMAGGIIRTPGISSPLLMHTNSTKLRHWLYSNKNRDRLNASC